MSFGEIVVVLIVTLLVIKPADIPSLVRKYRYIQQHFAKLKAELLSVMKITDEKLLEERDQEDHERMNYYLQKIIELEGDYKGLYTPAEVREKYRQVINKRLVTKENNKS